MSKTKVSPPGSTPQNPAPPRERLKRPRSSTQVSLWVRLVVSGLVTWHLFAVFMAPLSMPPTSQLVSEIVQGTPQRSSPMQWYLDAFYINHGYHFFAPEPGPGHLIRYQVVDDRGETIAEGEFPQRRDYWPRLRYHRHFMLSDQAVFPLYRRTPEEAQQMVLDAYARHLLREYDGAEARVTRVRHDMLAPIEKREGIALDAPHKYVTVMERVQRSSDLNRPAATTAADSGVIGSWQPSRPTGRIR